MLFASLVVGVEGADVEAEVFAGSGHRPCMDNRTVTKVMRQIARGVLAAAVLDTVAYKVEVLL